MFVVVEAQEHRGTKARTLLEALPHALGRSQKDLFQSPLRDGRRRSAPQALSQSQPLGSRPTTSASAATTRAQSSSSAFAKQCRKMARKEVTPAIKFDQAFDMAYRLAVKRLAADRRQGQVSLNKNASQFSEFGGSSLDQLVQEVKLTPAATSF